MNSVNIVADNSLIIQYGVEGNYKDVTRLAVLLCRGTLSNNIIIPSGDFQRANLFGDHIVDTLKHVRVFTHTIIYSRLFIFLLPRYSFGKKENLKYAITTL